MLPVKLYTVSKNVWMNSNINSGILIPAEKKIKITEKRIITYNPKLAKKQIYEIKKEVEKARLLKASQAKKSEYGDSAKYVIFTATDKKGMRQMVKSKFL